MIFCLVRLRDILYGEVARVFVRRDCLMFLGGEVAFF